MSLVVRPTEIGRSIPEILDSVRQNAVRITTRSLDTVETWHRVGQPGEVPFLNGWINYEDYSPVDSSRLAYYRDAAGVVSWRGVLRGMGIGSSGGWSQVCQIPNNRWWSENEEAQSGYSNIVRDGSSLTAYPTVRFYQGGLYVSVEPGHTIDFPYLILDDKWYWSL